ncbi:MAG: 30S ribosome-binding factor RbfA [Deltaproteobacteria bacterium]|nr:30S ribosome-binding factor RbfA [Deltaproteobacteria bacterium]
MPPTFKRAARISDLIIKEVSQMIVKGEIKDPRVSSAFITGAKVSDNLSVANIFFSVLEDYADKNEVLKGLESAKGFIKTRLSKKLKMRKIPDLQFKFDTALETAYRVDEVLREIGSDE